MKAMYWIAAGAGRIRAWQADRFLLFNAGVSLKNNAFTHIMIEILKIQILVYFYGGSALGWAGCAAHGTSEGQLISPTFLVQNLRYRPADR